MASGVMAPVQRLVADACVRIASSQPPQPPVEIPDIVLVTLDSQSLRAFPQWPWPRRLYAEAVRQLDAAGHRVVALQGNMSQNARVRAMRGFRDHDFDVLVATDIAARGIDVVQVSHVVNFDMPTTPDAYTHRIGRTGRAEVGRAHV